jgi:hypothetical protein
MAAGGYCGVVAHAMLSSWCYLLLFALLAGGAAERRWHADQRDSPQPDALCGMCLNPSSYTSTPCFLTLPNCVLLL